MLWKMSWSPWADSWAGSNFRASYSRRVRALLLIFLASSAPERPVARRVMWNSEPFMGWGFLVRGLPRSRGAAGVVGG